MDDILIIKLGAMGDVLRTTPLLRVLDGRITWVIKKESRAILEGIPFLSESVDINSSSKLIERQFDLVINLDDDYQSAELVSKIKKRELIGAFLKNGEIGYTDSSSIWFDMGLISKFGIEKANRLKKENKRSYQEIIFEMIGKRFNGEEYFLSFVDSSKQDGPKIIGIEDRVGEKWPMKRWDKYEELGEMLKRDGYSVRFFKQRDSILKYIKDIAECATIVSGDTLTMHVGLALKKKVVAIFTCTNPDEIFDYKRMSRVVSPLWRKYFYRRDFDNGATNAISVDTVYNAIKEVS